MTSRFADPDKTGYFVENGRLYRFATYRGVRRVLPPSIALEDGMFTIGCGQEQFLRLVNAASEPCED